MSVAGVEQVRSGIKEARIGSKSFLFAGESLTDQAQDLLTRAIQTKKRHHTWQRKSIYNVKSFWLFMFFSFMTFLRLRKLEEIMQLMKLSAALVPHIVCYVLRFFTTMLQWPIIDLG